MQNTAGRPASLQGHTASQAHATAAFPSSPPPAVSVATRLEFGEASSPVNSAIRESASSFLASSANESPLLHHRGVPLTKRTADTQPTGRVAKAPIQRLSCGLLDDEPVDPATDSATPSAATATNLSSATPEASSGAPRLDSDERRRASRLLDTQAAVERLSMIADAQLSMVDEVEESVREKERASARKERRSLAADAARAGRLTAPPTFSYSSASPHGMHFTAAGARVARSSAAARQSALDGDVDGLVGSVSCSHADTDSLSGSPLLPGAAYNGGADRVSASLAESSQRVAGVEAGNERSPSGVVDSQLVSDGSPCVHDSDSVQSSHDTPCLAQPSTRRGEKTFLADDARGCDTLPLKDAEHDSSRGDRLPQRRPRPPPPPPLPEEDTASAAESCSCEERTRPDADDADRMAGTPAADDGPAVQPSLAAPPAVNGGHSEEDVSVAPSDAAEDGARPTPRPRRAVPPPPPVPSPPRPEGDAAAATPTHAPATDKALSEESKGRSGVAASRSSGAPSSSQDKERRGLSSSSAASAEGRLGSVAAHRESDAAADHTETDMVASVTTPSETGAGVPAEATDVKQRHDASEGHERTPSTGSCGELSAPRSGHASSPSVSTSRSAERSQRHSGSPSVDPTAPLARGACADRRATALNEDSTHGGSSDVAFEHSQAIHWPHGESVAPILNTHSSTVGGHASRTSSSFFLETTPSAMPTVCGDGGEGSLRFSSAQCAELGSLCRASRQTILEGSHARCARSSSDSDSHERAAQGKREEGAKDYSSVEPGHARQLSPTALSATSGAAGAESTDHTQSVIRWSSSVPMDARRCSLSVPCCDGVPVAANRQQSLGLHGVCERRAAEVPTASTVDCASSFLVAAVAADGAHLADVEGACIASRPGPSPRSSSSSSSFTSRPSRPASQRRSDARHDSPSPQRPDAQNDLARAEAAADESADDWEDEQDTVEEGERQQPQRLLGDHADEWADEASFESVDSVQEIYAERMLKTIRAFHRSDGVPVMRMLSEQRQIAETSPEGPGHASDGWASEQSAASGCLPPPPSSQQFLLLRVRRAEEAASEAAASAHAWSQDCRQLAELAAELRAQRDDAIELAAGFQQQLTVLAAALEHTTAAERAVKDKPPLAVVVQESSSAKEVVAGDSGTVREEGSQWRARHETLAVELARVKSTLAEQAAVLDRLGLHPPFDDALVGAASVRLAGRRLRAVRAAPPQPSSPVPAASRSGEAVEQRQTTHHVSNRSTPAAPSSSDSHGDSSSKENSAACAFGDGQAAASFMTASPHIMHSIGANTGTLNVAHKPLSTAGSPRLPRATRRQLRTQSDVVDAAPTADICAAVPSVAEVLRQRIAHTAKQ